MKIDTIFAVHSKKLSYFSAPKAHLKSFDFLKNLKCALRMNLVVLSHLEPILCGKQHAHGKHTCSTPLCRFSSGNRPPTELDIRRLHP